MVVGSGGDNLIWEEKHISLIAEGSPGRGRRFTHPFPSQLPPYPKLDDSEVLPQNGFFQVTFAVRLGMRRHSQRGVSPFPPPLAKTLNLTVEAAWTSEGC